MVALSERPGADFFSPQARHVPGVLVRFGRNRVRYRARGRAFLETIEQHNPEALALMRGIAEGAHVHFDDLLFMNTSIELTRGCTSYAAAGEASASGHPIVGMNADETKGVERSEVVLRLHPDTGYAYTVCAMAGYLSFNFGMNETGLAVVNHLLFLRPGSSSTGTVQPMLLNSSILNRCRTVDEARQLLESLPPTGAGLTLTVADSPPSAVSMTCPKPTRCSPDVEPSGSLNSPSATTAGSMRKRSGRFWPTTATRATRPTCTACACTPNTPKGSRPAHRWSHCQPKESAGSTSRTPAATHTPSTDTDLQRRPTPTRGTGAVEVMGVTFVVGGVGRPHPTREPPLLAVGPGKAAAVRGDR